MPGKEIATQQHDAATALVFNETQKRTLQAAIAKSPAGRPPTEDEWNLFVFQAGTLGLNPFRGEIGMAKWSNTGDAPLVPYITWLGHLKLAGDQHKLTGVERFWCGPDGQWRDVWLEDEPPTAAKVVLWLEGLERPVTGVAKWSSWAKMGHPDKLLPNGQPIWKKTQAGKPYKEKDLSKVEPIGNWKVMPDHMLSVAAARLAAKVAARITGEENDLELAAETILFRDRQKRAFALARELGLTEKERHELSGGESWSTVDYEMMCEIVSRMEEMRKEGSSPANTAADGGDVHAEPAAPDGSDSGGLGEAPESVPVGEIVDEEDAEEEGNGQELDSTGDADGDSDAPAVGAGGNPGPGVTPGWEEQAERMTEPEALKMLLAEEGIEIPERIVMPANPTLDEVVATAQKVQEQAATESATKNPQAVLRRMTMRRLKAKYPQVVEEVGEATLDRYSLDDLARFEEELQEDALRAAGQGKLA